MKEFARRLRKESTDAERWLWQRLRNRELLGWKFRRQHPIGSYIVDFVCIEKRIIVELDGSQHAENQEADRVRSEYLEEKGYLVLRFWNNDVLIEGEGVLNTILSHLDKEDPSPQPSPLKRARER
jgi:very-short-patch-repair endonuclease